MVIFSETCGNQGPGFVLPAAVVPYLWRRVRAHGVVGTRWSAFSCTGPELRVTLSKLNSMSARFAVHGRATLRAVGHQECARQRVQHRSDGKGAVGAIYCIASTVRSYVCEDICIARIVPTAATESCRRPH